MFLLYRTEPSARKVEVVDCNFITVPLILAITAAYFVLSQSGLLLSYRGLQADLKENDL